MKTILNLTAWETRVADCFSQTRAYQSTQAEHQARITQYIYVELYRKHGKRSVYPAHTQGFVQGLCRAYDAHMMRNDIEFCYIVDGVMYSVDKNSKHATTRDYCEKVNPENGGAVLCRGDTQRGFFWRDSDKRFF